MEIDYINGPKTDQIFGMSKYQNEIHNNLNVELSFIEYTSLVKIMENMYNTIFPSKSQSDSLGMVSVLNKTGSLSNNKIFSNIVRKSWKTCNYIDMFRYIYIVNKEVKGDNIKHITYQELAYLLKFIKLKKTIVTCYDLIPWAYDKNRSFLWKNNMKGLKNAAQIITVSEFSKSEIIKYLKYPEDKIDVIYGAVDHDIYYGNRNREILKRLNIPENFKIILYVGSEQPRQNVNLLIKAFSKLKNKLPNIKLLKVGNPHSYGEREKLLKLIGKLGLEQDVIFIGSVLEEELPKWYNAADLLVYPCFYAGFGLPPLEAMACGTPVITSNTTSLPEVIGDAGIMINPHDHDVLSDKMHEVLINEGLKNEMVKKGFKRAKMFSWDKSAEKTMEIYDELSD